jgi:hypothetical protein
VSKSTRQEPLTDGDSDGTSPAVSSEGSSETTRTQVLWDRKANGGFPEVKELKRLVRDVIEPGRDLGHVDRDHGRKTQRPGDGQPIPDSSVESTRVAKQQPSGTALQARPKAEALYGAGDAAGYPGDERAQPERLRETPAGTDTNSAALIKNKCEDCG